jgi:hypothetical protein
VAQSSDAAFCSEHEGESADRLVVGRIGGASAASHSRNGANPAADLRRRAANWFKASTPTEKPIAA